MCNAIRQFGPLCCHYHTIGSLSQWGVSWTLPAHGTLSGRLAQERYFFSLFFTKARPSLTWEGCMEAWRLQLLSSQVCVLSSTSTLQAPFHGVSRNQGSLGHSHRILQRPIITIRFQHGSQNAHNHPKMTGMTSSEAFKRHVGIQATVIKVEWT